MLTENNARAENADILEILATLIKCNQNYIRIFEHVKLTKLNNGTMFVHDAESIAINKLTLSKLDLSRYNAISQTSSSKINIIKELTQLAVDLATHILYTRDEWMEFMSLHIKAHLYVSYPGQNFVPELHPILSEPWMLMILLMESLSAVQDLNPAQVPHKLKVD